MSENYIIQPGPPRFPTPQYAAPWGAVPGYRGRTRSADRGGGLTLGGVLLLVIGLLVIGSGMARLIQIGGLHVHPYLFVVAPIFPFLVFSRITELPLSTLAAMTLFAAIYTWSCADRESLSWIVKMFSGLVTIVGVSLLVRTRADFVAGVIGLMLAVGVLGTRGLSEEEPTESSLGVRAIENANKNSYSLYALPAMLLAGHVVLRYKSVPWPLKAMLIAAALASLAAIFMSGNRSGYLGAVIVAFLLLWDGFWEFKIKSVVLGVIVVGGVVAALTVFLTHFGSTEILNRRLEQTAQGTDSDTLRVNVFKACLRIGLENPLVGASQGRLANAISEQLNLTNELIGPHNVVGAIIGGSGLICFAALVWIGVSLWFWKPSAKYFRKRLPNAVIESKKLLRYMLILWLIRGMFNDEIISNPGFCIGLGLAIGLCAAAGRQAARELQDAPHPSQWARMAAVHA